MSEREPVWLVVGDCGDYYCERLHTISVALDRTAAALLAASARLSGARDGFNWADVRIQETVSGVLLDQYSLEPTE